MFVQLLMLNSKWREWLQNRLWIFLFETVFDWHL